MKPETRRLVILDVIIAVAVVLQLCKGVAPQMIIPLHVTQVVLLGYGLYLLSRAWTQLPP